jgi:hypothetical protein
MPKKKRYVDVVSTKLNFVEESASNPTFVDILRFMDRKEHQHLEKNFEFSLIDTTIQNCIVGIIITTQNKDIPPKRNKRNKVFHSLGIDIEVEGLAFANIFIYDISRNILLYEINRNGCFPKQLIDFIYAKWVEREDIRFELSFPAILRSNEYQRMLQMNYYKRIVIELYKPNELISCFDENTDSIENNILRHNLLSSNQSNADILKVEQIARSKKFNPMGLSRTMIQNLVDVIKLNIADRGFRSNIQTLKIEGYSLDPEGGNAIKHINILADTFNEFFKITAIPVQSDVQERERKEGIEALYHQLLPELRQLTR